MTIKFTTDKGNPIYVNPDFIVTIEPSPYGTHVGLSTGKEILLKESEDEVVSKIHLQKLDYTFTARAGNYEKF